MVFLCVFMLTLALAGCGKTANTDCSSGLNESEQADIAECSSNINLQMDAEVANIVVE